MTVAPSARSAAVRVLGLLMALVLVAAACTNSTDGESSSTTGSSDGATTTSGDGESAAGASGDVEVGEGPHGSFESLEGVPGVTDDEIRVALLSTGEANPIGY